MTSQYPHRLDHQVVTSELHLFLRTIRSVLIISGMVLFAACQGQSAQEPRAEKEPAIAPGTVHLEAAVKSCEKVEVGDVHCIISVLHVVEYGSGAGNLPASTELRTAFGGRIFENLGVNRDTLLTEGRQLDLTLLRQFTKEGAPARPPWRAVQIHTQ